MNFDQNKISLEFAQIGDVRLHCAKAGNGEKLVVLLHGFPEFWYCWRHQLENLSDEYTVVAPDLRGYNLSDKPERVEDYRIDKLVADAANLIEHFGRERAFVVGHDWGALVAWAFAQRRPEMVEKLAALQVPPPAAWRANFTFKQLVASWYMFFFQLPQVPEWLFSLNDYALLERTLKSLSKRRVFDQADFAAYKKSWSQPFALTGAINYYRANVFQNLFTKQGSRGKIKVPTLFIYGEGEKAIVAETARRVERFIDAPYSELRIPNAGHWVQQEAAAEVNQSLRNFFAEPTV